MAKRDVQLVIRARSEADRAIDSVSSALRTLAGMQDDVADSGQRTSNTLQRLGSVFQTLDAAVSKIDQSVATAQAAFSAQSASLAENEARYASLRNEIQSAQQAIINTRLAMQTDGSYELVRRLASAQQAYRNLTGEAGRLEARIAGQRADVAAAGDAYQGMQNAAAAAQVAINDLASASKREALESEAGQRQVQEAIEARAEATRRAAAEEERALQEQARNIAAVVAANRRAQENEEANNALLGVRTIDSDNNAARASAAVFEEDARAKREAARATEELDAAAARLRARARPLAVEQERINAEMREARTLYRAGRISIRDYTAEMQRLEAATKRVTAAQDNMNRNGSKELKGLFGLRPYEMQNLSYQINDVVTGLISGQPPMQILAQQGGQIIQLFPQLLNGILKYGRALTLAAVAITPLIIGMGRLNQLAGLQREFAADLELSADAARYNAVALVDNVDALDRYGASLEDAKDAVSTFLAESVRPEVMDRMGEASLNLAKITGQDLTDAAKDVAKAFTGGYEELAEFDNKLNFLTLSEREQIRAMFDSGDASEARRLAFQLFYDDAQDGAKELETSWSRMARTMSIAWSEFKDYLGDMQVFQDIKEYFDEVAIGATYLINRIRGMRHEAAALAAVGQERTSGVGARLGQLSAANAAVDPLDTQSNRNLKSESDKRWEEENRKRNRRGRSTKTLADYQSDLNREIERENREREIQAANLGRTNVLTGQALIMERRRQTIAEAIRKYEEQATKNSKRQLTITQAQREEIARTVGLEFDAKNAKAAADAEREDHERRLNELTAKRADLLEAMQFTSPGSDQFDELESAVLLINMEMQRATEQSIAFWTAVAGDPEKMALLGKTAQEISNIVADLENAQKTVMREALEAGRAQAERGLGELRDMQSLLQEQIEFAQLQGESGRAGILAEQLDQVNQRLTEGAMRAIEFWRAVQADPEQVALMGLTPEAINNIVLGLENVIASSQRMRTQFLATGETLNRDLALGGTNALDQFAQSIVQGENAIKSFGMAFAQMAADFLLQIGRMIAQQAIFNAISGGTAGGAGGAGGFLSGLIGGLFHGGGVVGGKGSRGRAVSGAIFANATRYHKGGVAGLKPNEVPAILERGEEVLTRSDVRHRNNGGGGAGQKLRQVLAFGDDQIAGAMAGNAGEEVVVTHIRRNRTRIRQELGIG